MSASLVTSHTTVSLLVQPSHRGIHQQSAADLFISHLLLLFLRKFVNIFVLGAGGGPARRALIHLPTFGSAFLWQLSGISNV